MVDLFLLVVSLILVYLVIGLIVYKNIVMFRCLRTHEFIKSIKETNCLIILKWPGNLSLLAQEAKALTSSKKEG